MLNHSSNYRSSQLFATFAGLLLSLGYLPTALAHPHSNSPRSQRQGVTTLAQQKNSQQSRGAKVKLPSLPDRSYPGGRGHNGSRGSSDALAVTTLIPLYAEGEKQYVWSTTASPQPVFWVHVPVQPDSVPESLEFVLRDGRNGPKVYSKTMELPTQTSIVRISNADMPALEPGKSYNWFIKYNVRSASLDEDATAEPGSGPLVEDYDEGWIEYRPANLAVEGKSLAEQAVIYGEAGYWHEALDLVAQLHRDNPQDGSVQADWKSLLEQVGLEEIAEEPLL